MFNIINIIHRLLIIITFIIISNEANALTYSNEPLPKHPLIWELELGNETSLDSLPAGEEVMLVIPLSNHLFEEEILEWKQRVKSQGYKILHSEIKKDLFICNDLDEAKAWIESQGFSSDEEIKHFLSDPSPETHKKIFIPYRRLILTVKRV